MISVYIPEITIPADVDANVLSNKGRATGLVLGSDMCTHRAL